MKLRTSERAKKGLKSTMIVRPLSAVTGLLILVLLSRNLSPATYGTYFSVWAAVELLILVSNGGLMHAAYRYVSASQWADGRLSISGPVIRFFLWRVVGVTAFSLAVLGFGPHYSSYVRDLSQGGAGGILVLVVVIFFAEALARFIEILFDAMMLQGLSQLTTICRSLFRLVCAAFAIYGVDTTETYHIILAEALACLLGMILALGLFIRTYRRRFIEAPELEEPIGKWRYFKFVAPAFAAQLLGTFYGPDSIKLIMGSTSGASAVAGFGFAYSIVSIIQRYMPVNMFVGLFRALFVAASNRQNSDGSLDAMFNFVVKLNVVFILAGFVFFRIAADSALDLLSNGRYNDYAGVMSLMLVGLVPVAVHLTISMYCVAKETSLAPLIATLVSAFTLPMTLFLTSRYGAMGGAAVFLLSEALWVLICFVGLKWSGAPLRFSGWAYVKIAVACSLCAEVPQMLSIPTHSASIWIAAMVGLIAFLALLYKGKVFDQREVRMLQEVLPFKFFARANT